MTTMADLVADTKRMTYGSLSEQLNLVAVAAAAGATSIVTELSLEGVSPGTVVSSGLNVWYVKGVNVATSTLQVIPGFQGAPQNPVSIGDFLYIRPRVTDHYVFSALNDVLRAMSSPQNGLYKIGEFDLPAETVYQTYDIPTEAQGMVGILRVRALVPSSPDEWVDIPDRFWRWQGEENLIRVLYPIPASSILHVVYKSGFTVATSLDDDVVADCGLSDTMTDIPPLGATVTLLRTTEARRGQTQIQSDPRRADEVAAGANATAARELDRDFKARIGDEHLRLISRTGIFRGI